MELKVLIGKFGNPLRGIEVSKMRGFALLGRATQEQLKNYKQHYIDFVEIEFKPIWEANRFLKNMDPDGPYDFPSDEPVLKWCQSRQYMARWSFDKEDLPAVLGLWMEMKEKQAAQQGKYDRNSTWPEENNDWFE